ncbi:hypothetical protein C7B82_18860 [Stenomitos frigidus ULC18]|uniref:Uncharacterized protein n=1 Tax=Stenomitos frigidus ULC18 TaxID=2107698 RepID=A0A2T1E1Y2_9CYAN|nr:hypothetical protein C7B82_18860 [Stenomitos frigidus ULC18]
MLHRRQGKTSGKDSSENSTDALNYSGNRRLSTRVQSTFFVYLTERYQGHLQLNANITIHAHLNLTLKARGIESAVIAGCQRQGSVVVWACKKAAR